MVKTTSQSRWKYLSFETKTDGRKGWKVQYDGIQHISLAKLPQAKTCLHALLVKKGEIDANDPLPLRAKFRKWKCHRCEEWKPKAAYSDSQYHHRTEPGREAICLSCEEDRPMHVCGLCKQSKAESEYFPATWRNRTREGRQSLC